MHWIQRSHYLTNINRWNDFHRLFTLVLVSIYFFTEERPRASDLFPVLLYSKALMNMWSFSVTGAVQLLAELQVALSRMLVTITY
ncbi:hypothetical protein Bpfe_016032 [Biomphalaria pfeifferi]|uniref:Uncharacterized protein n=1 Tax=Biomphalaria pfeifferi TaxID=112525 RepID=A0AAD8F8N5_BIOPF|nr:hypothetical protein Bpfe_016032 [Biomphalaria pfeifferi]